MVVGAGIGGAVAALLLARGGTRVTLVDRVTDPRDAGAGILLQPNGLAVLYALGLEGALSARAARVAGGSIYSRLHRPLITEPIPGISEEIPAALVIPRGDLFAILLDAVQREPNIDLRLGVTATGVLYDGSGVTVRTRDRSVIDLRADLIVGADGVHSVVRDFVDPRARRRASGYAYVRGLVSCDAPVQFGEWWSELGLFGAAPVSAPGAPSSVYFFTSILPGPVAQAVGARDVHRFRSLWCRAVPAAEPILARIRTFDDLLVNEVTRIDCRTFAHGRLALLGDAAHAMAPNLGQGANSALVDAAVLMHALSTEPTIEGALRAYDARRRPAVRRVQDDADRFARAAQLRSRALRRLRDALLPVIASRVDVKSAVRRMLQEDVSWLRRVSAPSAMSELSSARAADERTSYPADAPHPPQQP